MVSAHDAAAYIIGKRPAALTAMKLQKLLFYGQAWSLAWDGAPLFAEPIAAWAGGPVVSEVFNAYRGQLAVNVAKRGDVAALSPAALATLDAVLGFYGTFDGDTLSELTHRETPWLDAWRSAPRARPSPEITHDALRAFYRAELVPAKAFPESFRRGVDLVLSLDPEELADLDADGGTDVSPGAEVAFLEGRGPDPWRT